MADLGRATRDYASAYIRDRIFWTRLYAPEKRLLVSNLNGAIPKGVTITASKWQTNFPYSVVMSNPVIEADGRSSDLTVLAQLPGRGWIRATHTLSNGETYVQQYQVVVASQPYYVGDTYINGPVELNVTA
jgi:hypothetical protein